VQSISLTTPVQLNVGDNFLVAIFMQDVIALAPNDKYPWALDTSGVATGSFWDRSAPDTFNLDNLSGAVPINQNIAGATWNPGAGHLIIRAFGTAVPEPSVFALGGLAAVGAALLGWRRCSTRQ
jgi:PEP-CTERM motif